MKPFKYFLPYFIALCALPSCVVVRPGEAAIDIHYGKVQKEVLMPGLHHGFALFGGKRIVRYNTREINHSINIGFHTKEGIDVKAEVTVLFHLNIDSLISIYNKFGTEYERILINDNIITALRQAGLAYKATELITQRSAIERTIKARLDTSIGHQGFVVHSVMLKQIDLPDDIELTIEAQLKAEQNAIRVKVETEISRTQLAFQLEKSRKEKEQDIANQRLQLDFMIEKQKKENERLLLEAYALKRQQEMIDSSLTANILKLKMIEASISAFNSPNSKIIMTDGKSPFVLRLNDEK